MMLIIFLASIIMSFIDLIIFEIAKFSFFAEIKKMQKINFNRLPIFFVIFLGAFMEEIIFRLPLKITKNNIILSLSVFCIYFIGDKIVDIDLFSFYTWIKMVPIVFIFLYFQIFVKNSFLEFINENYYKIYFYLITISFGLIHVVNFYKVVPSNLVYLIPIFVTPQIIMSFFIAYIRIKSGFFWGFALHFLYNLPIIIFYLLNS